MKEQYQDAISDIQRMYGDCPYNFDHEDVARLDLSKNMSKWTESMQPMNEGEEYAVNLLSDALL